MHHKLPVGSAKRSRSLEVVHAVIIDHESLLLEERRDPVPARGQVLVATHFAGINAADLLQRRGFYPSPPGWPADVPGMELSGRVLEVGSGVDAALVGRRVCAIVGGGAQATRALVPAAHLIDVPDTVALDEAGGFAEAFITAYDALVLQGRLERGQRLLVSGASGGVGSAAVQIGRLLGAHVTAVTRTPAHHQVLIELGADEVVSLEEVMKIAPVDVVLELVGAAHLSLAQDRLANFARVVVIGVAGGGSRVDVDLLNFMRTRSTLTGSTLRSRSHDEKAEVITHVRNALDGPWRRREIRVPLAATFALADVEEAYAFFAQPGKFGKVLLAMPDADA
jgi:NADPH:quinone reductase-like Zn-dependent oxidoreductase